jgi:cyclopropane fatty-acyl-phospholipid synthase-like methyltransferase
MTTTLPTLTAERLTNTGVIDHFRASAALYKVWSPEGHLHFGYWAWPTRACDRKAMLENLVHRVVRELKPMPGQRFADLGCGYGSSARLVAGTYNTRVEAFTVVPQQVEEGQAEADRERVDVNMHLRDFRRTGLADGSVDGVYALESLCYDDGPGKRNVLAEAARILKPGGRIALTDGFILRTARGWRKRMVETTERGWAVPCFPRQRAFLNALERAGFTDVHIHDLSWRVAPSALHGLPLLAWTWLSERFMGERLDALERAHLKSCFHGILLGTQRDLFRYLFVTATKR